MRPLACALALAVLLAGCTDAAPSQVRLQPGKPEEVNVPLRTGDRLTWSWTSDVALAFDVHRHDAGKVLHDVETTALSDTGSLVAAEDTTYSLRWVNPGTVSASLHYEHGVVRA